MTKVTPNSLPYNRVRAHGQGVRSILCRTPVSKFSCAPTAGVRCAVRGPVRAEGRLGDAYEGYSQAAWHVLPCSAILELIAVILFAVNMVLTLAQPPAHVKRLRQAAA